MTQSNARNCNFPQILISASHLLIILTQIQFKASPGCNEDRYAITPKSVEDRFAIGCSTSSNTIIPRDISKVVL